MSIRHALALPAARWALALAVAGLSASWFAEARAQFINQQVGGVSIDSRGVLKSIRPDELNELKQKRQAALADVPGDMKQSALRKVSLRSLEEAIETQRKTGAPVPDEIRCLAGLQRIQYVFVYPEHRDIVIAGPGEGWKLNAMGEVVGVTTERPVLLLDDLLVALRSIETAQASGILCSIDPTPEGLTRTAALTRRLSNPGDNIDPILKGLEEAMGRQTITVKGVPAASHFARVLVAADYRMKRIAMGFDESPVARLSSYLQMIKTKSGKGRGMMPRWWLEPTYEAVLADAEGLSYEFRGAGVKALVEDQVINAAGQRSAAAKTDPLAKKWADTMTAHYDELSRKDAVFGQLRNCIDMAVLAALVSKENLTAKCGWSMPLLAGTELPVELYNAPSEVDSQASAVRRGNDWVLSVSGGVMINPWQLIANPQPGPKLDALRSHSAAPGASWWWD